ncbi:MAG: tetratricopeptide repeat protein, partial [Muriicola sp.]|nr:tetratricopeptide repeat protein [Muriicola sp.]
MHIQWISIRAQDQRIADSLVKIYQEDTVEGSNKLELLRNLAFNQVNDLDLSLKYAEELIALSKLEDNALYLYRGYLQKGNSTRRLGDLEVALDAFFKAGQAAIRAQFITGEGTSYMSIADTYSEMGNANNAKAYYDKAITLLRKTNDSVSIAIALLNAGDQYFKDKKHEKALAYFEEAGRISENINFLSGTVYFLGNTGMVYAEQGKDVLAKANINAAITILEEMQDYSPIVEYLTTMSNIYTRQQDFTTAFSYAQRGLELAKNHGLKESISDANLQLSEMYEHIGNTSEALKYYKNHIAYRDSVKNIAAVQQMADLRTDFEVSQKQSELDLLSQKKENQQTLFIAMIVIAGLTIILLLTLYWYYRSVKSEKKISENLLLNILPAETAEELKKSGKVQAKKFDSVTVMFTDFQGFTRLAGNLSPEKLVESVDYYFSKFDQI